ncbi:DNA-directed RNA polymerase subunit B' [Mortierella sp. GBA30]|nr:DNA-directed RNA polymerase subunit B' [Mortierella sp. GBA30]
MSISQRKRLLELFFTQHSHLANIDKIFVNAMKTTFVDATLQPPTSVDIDELVVDKLTYNANANVSNQSFTVPWMTLDGTFVINGVERVPLIQEVKARNVIYTSSIVDEKGLSVIATTRFSNARVPVRLVLKASDVYLDASAISHQLEEEDEDDDLPKATTKVSLGTLVDIFGSGVDAVDVLGGMGSSGATISMLLSALRPTHDVTSRNVLVENIFNLGLDDVKLVDTIVINTILYMFNQCVLVYFGNQPSDRDNYANKWLRTSGDIIAPIVADVISRKNANFAKTLDTRLMSMMRTGNITIGRRMYPKMVVQVSKRSTFDVLSSVRKIAIPCDENSAGIGMRQLHPSQNGFICLSETPEGKTTGLLTSPIIQRRTSLRKSLDTSPDEEVEPVVVNLSDVDKRLLQPNSHLRTWIIFDGTVIGYFFSNINNDDIYEEFRDKMKRKYKYISISSLSKTFVEIRTWSGRPMRPLLVVPDTSPVDWREVSKCKSWKELVANGLVEYLDPSETNIIEDKIAGLEYSGDFANYKYMEIHPCTLFGIPASLIPFANHNQSARNIFASSMIKQAMQLIANPPLYHEGKYLVYGQRPLVDTVTADVLGLNSGPNGINLVVCVLAYTGYNMEDAIIVNKTSVDNGLFLSMVRNVYNKSVDGDVAHDEDEILVLEGDDAKKVTAIKFPTRQTTFNGTTVTRMTPPNIPHAQRGKLLVKSDEYRELSIGDKIASRHAQKGVIGRVMDANDMPFTGDGIRPDIIFNPHGIPSRMTMGQLLEGVVGTQCAIDGSFFDGTSFNEDLDIDAILEMEQNNSNELYSGMSGEYMGEHHLGIIYYMPLKHQSKDKVYVRWVGPNELFSRQPVAGKKKGGGLKFGEMEMDAMISHGAANAINDTIRQSDMCEMPTCKTCGLFPAMEKECSGCHGEDIVDIEAPYSLKQCLECGLKEPYVKFYKKDSGCSRCKEDKRIKRVHAKEIEELKQKLCKLEEENAQLLDDKKFLKSVIKEQVHEIGELESVRVECDTKIEHMEEEIYALKSTQHVLDVRVKEMGSLLSMNNMGLAGYMTKVDEMKEEVDNLNKIMGKQMELNHSMTGLLNKCIVHKEGGDHLYIAK